MNRGGAEDSSPHLDRPRRGRVARDVPIPGAVGSVAAFCAGTVLVALPWVAGMQLGGLVVAGLVLMGAASVWVVAARLAVASHENSHWDNMMTGAMEPRHIIVGVEAGDDVWAISVDGRAPTPAALCGEADAVVVVDTANLCMASPRRLRRLPRLGTDRWQPVQTGTIRNIREALSLVGEAVRQRKANGSGPTVP